MSSGCHTGASAREEDGSEEEAVQNVRVHFGKVLGFLLDEKAKNLGSMISEMSQIRIPTIRKLEDQSTSFPEIGTTIQSASTASSGDNMSTSTDQRTLDRMDSSMMERAALTEYMRQAPTTVRRSIVSDRNPTRHQARKVESETNEHLPPVMAPPTRPALQLQMVSMGMSSLMESQMTESSTPSPVMTYSLPSTPLIMYDELFMKYELGRGQFASVKLSLWRGVEVAVKEWHTLTDRESMDMACQEASTLACLRHPCVVSFYGMLNNGPSPGLVVEYLPHLSLKNKLRELKGGPSDTQKLKVAVALRAARGMEFLHNRSVIHFDLKCENLLCDLRDLDNPIVKIGDVGLSKAKIKTFVSGNMRGTLPWMAPELFPSIERVGSQGNITDLVNEKVDVYSFGVVLWEIWEMGEMPYRELSPRDLLEGIMQGSLRLDRPHGCHDVWAQVMHECLQRAPEKRPDFSYIVSRLEELCNGTNDAEQTQ